MTVEHGVAAIGPRLYEIIEMLLPAGEGQMAAATRTSLDDLSKPPSLMMGPACALYILAQNSKCYLPSYREVGTDVKCYFRDTAGPYA